MIYVYSNKDMFDCPNDGRGYCSIGTVKIRTNAKKSIVITDKEIINLQNAFGPLCGLLYLYRHQDKIENDVYFCVYPNFVDMSVRGISKCVDTNMEQFYCCQYGARDLYRTLSIVHSKFPELKFLQDFVYTNDSYFMQKKEFVDYCSFLFGVLFEFCAQLNIANDIDVARHISSELGMYMVRDINFQVPMLYYLSCCLSAIYINK